MQNFQNMRNKSSYLFKSMIDTGASPSQKAVPQAQKLEEKQHCGYISLFFKLHKFISRCQEWRCITNLMSIKLWLFRWINKRSYRNRNVLPLIKLWYFCCIIERNLPTTLGQGNGPHSVSHWKTALLHDSWDSPVVVILYTKNLNH